MAKRLTEEELEHDPLIDFYTRVMGFYYSNKQMVIGGALLLVLLIGGTISYNLYISSQEQQAQRLLGTAEQYFMEGDYQSALNGADASVGFINIINNYGGTDAANLATYYAAVSEYKLGNSQEALNYIEDYDYPYGIVGVGPIAFHASILQDLEKHELAAEKYVQAAEWVENEVTTPKYYYQAADAYHDAGEYQKAKELVSTVVEEYPQANASGKAERLLGLLETKLASNSDSQ